MTTTPSEAQVAVIMTCYNEGAYIGAAVRSVLEQSRADLIGHIVIVDDGSEAATVAVLKDIEGWDERITVKYGSGGRGLAAQRNLAMEAVTLPFVAMLDGDDLWTKDKLAEQMPIITADPATGLVYSEYYTFSSDDLSDASRASVLSLDPSDLTRAYFLNDPPIIPSTILIRRAAFEKIGGFDATIRVFEDTDFYLRLSKLCRFALVSKPLAYKRYRTTSITGGRKDLMAHHAFVALKAAAAEPRLLPLVTQRLAERARKLGNHRFILGDFEEGKRLLKFAVQLNKFNLRAWTSLIVVGLGARSTDAVLSVWLKGRKRIKR